jgi:TolA-binding protein
VEYREIVKRHAWTESGPRAVLALGAMQVTRGGTEGAKALEELAALYRPAELSKRSGLSAQTKAEAEDAGSWSEYHAGCVWLQAGKKDEAQAAFERVVLLYPKSGYARAADGILKKTGNR